MVSGRRSPHANMVRDPDSGSVVGDFAAGEFRLPVDSPDPLAGEVVARTFQRDGRYYMALRHPEKPEFVGFSDSLCCWLPVPSGSTFSGKLTGVLRRLPLQWSTAKQAFFPLLEYSGKQRPDAFRICGPRWRPRNSAWNLYCARCHTTNLEIHERDEWHTRASVTWQEKGIGCEACHGPGSLHVAYMESLTGQSGWRCSHANHLEGRPVAYVANADKLPKEQAMSVCARLSRRRHLFRHTRIFTACTSRGIVEAAGSMICRSTFARPR